MLDKNNGSDVFDPDDPDMVLTVDVNTDSCEKYSTTNTDKTFTKEDHFPKREMPTSGWTQFRMLLWRNFKQSKGRLFNPYEILYSLLLGICLGLAYFQIDQSRNTFRDRVGMIFFGVGYWGFVLTVTAVIGFSEDRAVVCKDRCAGMYRLSAYYAAKTVGELPQVLVVPIIFLTVAYFMVSLGDVTNFFVFCGVNLLYCLIMQSVGHVIGISMNTRAGLVSASTVMLVNVQLGGFYIIHLPQWFGWTKYLSVSHYPFATLVIAILKDTLPTGCNNTTHLDTNCTHDSSSVVTAEYYLQDIGIELPIYFYLGMMCLILVSLKLLGYLLLRVRSIKVGI